ncbi:hypothetical protein C0U40_19440 [Amylibacter cionae]|nr:hypothetical protein C0U40_19440 [Amylibacter cionae]
MKRFAIVLAAIVLAVPYLPVAIAGQPVQSATSYSEVFHGGGCRKSSPPGQCCHKQTSTGRVHCH